MLYMLLDVLFLYVPLINEEAKCLTLDKRVKIAALVFRSVGDSRYLIRIYVRIKDGWGKSPPLGKLLGLAVCVLPIPQVVVLSFLPNMRGFGSLKIMKFLNSLIVLQYLARAYPLYRMCKAGNGERKNPKRLRYKRFMIILNLSAFLLASHVLGAFWYLFSIQREIDCWGYAGRSDNRSDFSTFCDESGLKNVTLIHILCPINPPDATKFDFGIFLYALQSGMQGSTNFPQKLFQCFSWGLRNLSSFASNLNGSTYGWENLFVVFISISGLVLFMYLLGIVQTYMQGTDISDSIREKTDTIKLMLLEYALPKEMESKVKLVVKARLENDEDLVVENMFSILSNMFSNLSSDYYEVATDIKSSLFMDKLKKVDGLQDKDEVYREICKYLEPMIYKKGRYIIREGEPLDMMFFVTWGTVLTYATNKNGGSNGSSGTIQQLKKDGHDLYGEGLITWAEGPCELSNLPISDITVKCHDKAEVFALQAKNLKFIASKFPSQFNMDSSLTIAVDNGTVN
uniref:cyclic nucleotide-gated ion channel 1-like isoform X2 n=1 Tax=Fragaria vesca subsp. vesca TaxID=101020 RepID=UPI0005C9F8DC|nr:PREDICTED: cyclic nucleotide-gated ion channel 1-like isoform X2 [Fragaria vesca subsp. vesca]